MATLDQRGKGYRIIFYYQGQRFQHALKTENPREASQLKTILERNLELVHQGTLHPPEGADLSVFLLSNGQAANLPKAEKPVTLTALFAKYQAERATGKERNTLYTEDIHIKHLLHVIGGRTTLQELPARLQKYVDARAEGKISQVTIKKELGTLTSLWNRWATNHGIVKTSLSLRNLEYPKGPEKPPFQTWEQIERKAKGDKESPLWGCVFLTVPQIDELVKHVRQVKYKWKNSSFPWIAPMFAFCAYTGARRSEMLRSRVEDIDFERGEVTIREKKKDRSKHETYRKVPLVPKLREAMSDWLAVHPGGDITFCKTSDKPLTPNMAEHYFRWALDGSKWAVLKGWHVLRHSFISNMASRGVDQRVIMELVGHLNEETTRRYQHLLPNTIQSAMTLVFGDTYSISHRRQP